MMYYSIALPIICCLPLCYGSEGTAGTQKDRDFYSHSVKSFDGQRVFLSKFRGKVSLVVNVASECGFTDRHYKGLVTIQRLLEQTGRFTVLAFPCNQFGAQEPKDSEDIMKFAKETYDVNFPIFEKMNVINDNIPDVWQFLAAKSGHAPNWNFWKYLIGPFGDVLGAWGPWSDVEEIFPQVKGAVDKVVSDLGAELHGPKRPLGKPQADKLFGEEAKGPPSPPDAEPREPTHDPMLQHDHDQLRKQHSHDEV